MGLAIVIAAVVAAIALSQKHGAPTATIRPVSAPALTVQDVVAGLVLAQNANVNLEGAGGYQGEAAAKLEALASSIAGTGFAGALNSVASLVRARNLPANTAKMSGALVALVTIMYSYESEPAVLNLYADALDKVGFGDMAANFRSKASSSTRSMVLVNPVTGEQAPLIPPALKAQVDQAIASGDPTKLRAAATALQQAGLPASAQALLAKIQS